MACSLPVICTSVAGCAEDLVRENGIRVAPGDVRQLSEAMRTVANRCRSSAVHVPRKLQVDSEFTRLKLVPQGSQKRQLPQERISMRDMRSKD